MRMFGVAVLALSALAAGDATAQNEDFSWRGTIAQGDAIEIRGVNGSVRAVRASGTEVVVTAVKREGRRGYVWSNSVAIRHE